MLCRACLVSSLLALLTPVALFGQEAAPMGDEPPVALILGIVIAMVLIMITVSLVVMGIVSFLVYQCFSSIPEAHRTMEPWKAFLLMIPCFNLVWNFIVFPGLAKSFQNYFQSIGRTDVGDCGAQLALWYSIAVACCLVPYLNAISGIASLVLLIIFLVKAFQLKGMIPGTATVEYPKV